MKLTDKQRASRALKRKRVEEREETAEIIKDIIRAVKAEPLKTQRYVHTAVYKSIRATKSREFAKESEVARKRGLIPVSLAWGRKVWVTRAIARRMAEEYPWLPSEAEIEASKCGLANPQ